LRPEMYISWIRTTDFTGMSYMIKEREQGQDLAPDAAFVFQDNRRDA